MNASPIDSRMPSLIYISFASVDEDHVRQLETHLAAQVQTGVLSIWHRGRIMRGDPAEVVVAQHLSTARVIVLLLSADYLATRSEEVARALEQHEERAAHVLPVQLRPTIESGDAFHGLTTVPAAPISTARNADAAWASVAQAIVEIVKARCAPSVEKPGPSSAQPSAAPRDDRSPTARLSPKQAERIRMLVAHNESDAALKELMLIAAHWGDRRLRASVTAQLGELNELSRLPLERRVGHTRRVRGWLTEQVEAREDDSLEERSDRESMPSGGDKGGNAGRAVAFSRRPLLVCRGLSKHFGSSFRLPPIDLELRHGEIAGVVGPNGAGKTTLLRMIAGELARSAGTVHIGSLDDRGRKLENRVTHVPQTPEPWSGTLHVQLRRRAALFGRNDPDWNADVIEENVELFRLQRYLDSPYSALSAGFRMRAAIAGALVADPGVLVLDEPLAPLDPPSQQELLQELSTRASGKGTAVVVTSQHVQEIESIADVVVLLFRGRAEVQTRRQGHHVCGRLFEVDVAGPSEAFVDRLKALEREGTIERMHLGTSSAIVQFRAEQTLAEASQALGHTGVIGVRDISRSALAKHYEELLAQGRWTQGSIGREE